MLLTARTITCGFVSDLYVDLVEPLFTGTINIFKNQFAPALDGLINIFLSQFDFSSNAFYKYLGISSTKYEASIFNVAFWIACSLALIIFVFSIVLANMNVLGDQKNSVLELIIRFPITFVLIAISRPVLQEFNDWCQLILDKLSSYSEFSSFVDSAETLYDQFAASMTEMFAGIFILILWISIMIEFIKLALEVIERYVVVCILHIFSPVGASLFISRTTASVMTNYIRMYGSQLFLLICNKLFLYLFIRLVVSSTVVNTIMGCFFAIAFLKAAQRIDSYMKSLGLTVAQTGSVLLDSIGMAARTVGNVLKSGGNLTGTALQRAGANAGNFGMAAVGASLSGLARGDVLGPSNAEKLTSFARMGGLENINPANKQSSAVKALTDSIANGRPKIVSQAKQNLQTEAIKAAFGSEGAASFKAATGLNVADITTATIDGKKGTINGVAQTKNSLGQIQNVAFTADTFANGKTTSSFSGFADGSTRYVSTSVLSDGSALPIGYEINSDYSSISEGGQSLTSTLTGCITNNDTLGTLGVTSDIVGDGYISHYSSFNPTNPDEGCIGFTDMRSGKLVHYGSAGLDVSSIVSEHDLESDNGVLHRYMPEDMHITENSWVSSADGQTVCCDVSNKSDSYGIRITRPIAADLDPKSRANLKNLGTEAGFVKINIIPHRQSNKFIHEDNK